MLNTSKLGFLMDQGLDVSLQDGKLKVTGISAWGADVQASIRVFIQENKGTLISELRLQEIVRLFDANDRTIAEYKQLSIEGEKLCRELSPESIKALFREVGEDCTYNNKTEQKHSQKGVGTNECERQTSRKTN